MFSTAEAEKAHIQEKHHVSTGCLTDPERSRQHQQRPKNRPLSRPYPERCGYEWSNDIYWNHMPGSAWLQPQSVLVWCWIAMFFSLACLTSIHQWLYVHSHSWPELLWLYILNSSIYTCVVLPVCCPCNCSFRDFFHSIFPFPSGTSWHWILKSASLTYL